MSNRPKRRKHRDNPYKLEIRDGVYIITFIDGKGTLQDVVVSEEIFYTFDGFELSDKKLMNEEERHFERFALLDESLHERLMVKEEKLEDAIIMKCSLEELRAAINLLPEIQKRRIKSYYFDELTLDAIAQIEGCTKRAVKFSIDIGIEKIKKILKK